MNFDQDFEAFSAKLDDLWAIKGQPLTAGVRMAFFRALCDFPLHEVEAGLFAHSRDPKRGQFLPMPADVIAQIQIIVADDGRPGPEEAWALALKSRDEAVTVVWTAEMSEAMGVCQPLLACRDEVGARMAFKEAYSRLLAEARAARRPTQWTVSLGHDTAGREAALLPHVEAGRLPRDVLPTPAIGFNHVLHLPPPDDASAKTLAARANALEKLAKLRDEYVNRAPATTPGELERQRTERLKAEAAKKVEVYQAAHAGGQPA